MQADNEIAAAPASGEFRAVAIAKEALRMPF